MAFVAASPVPGIRRAAYADGVEHVYLRNGARGQRSLCTDVLVTGERFERPRTSRCETCLTVLGELEQSYAIPESEQRLLDGNR